MIDLPASPGPREATPRELGFGAQLTSPFGGPTQYVDRLGSRWALDVTLPPMPYDVGRVWVSRLVRAKKQGGRMAFPQPGFSPGSPGTTLVKGAGQTGKSLLIDGFTPGYQVKEGQFFSVLTGGRRYLYQATADVTASGLGEATVPFEPMLRKSPTDNAAVEFAAPMIEGFVQGPETAWTIDVARTMGLTFTLAEAE